MTTAQRTLAVIGGSGLYDLPGLGALKTLDIETPYGAPSAPIVEGMLGATRLLFLARHGKGHRIGPSDINYRANICALKLAGATHLLGVSAVGSMHEDIAPGDLVVVDQYIDLTKRRVSTFFEPGIVGHVAFADPVCPHLAGVLEAAATDAVDHALPGGLRGSRVHRGGTYLCMEGPQFSTRAESMLYRKWGVSVIGMTGMPEAKLAREAELPFACLALATDYDCWHVGEEAVTVEAVMATMARNVEAARKAVAGVAAQLGGPTLAPEKSPAFGALKGAVMTSPDAVTPELKAKLGWLLPSLR
jgi:5'-methylthioadenosine phosphorylase